MAHDRDRVDAAVIVALAGALRDWEAVMGKPAALKPLREAVWFYWQEPRLPKPRVRGKYPKGFPWSAAARAAYEADGERARLVIEHAQPMRLLLRQILESPRLEVDAVSSQLWTGLACVILTPEEDQLITRAGLATRMPEGWQEGGDLWARHRAAGLDPEGFETLE